MKRIANDQLQVSICPEVGASVTDFSIIRPAGTLPLMRPTPSDFARSSQANFLMAPYSNRIRDAAFLFRGERYQLRLPEKHAIHGDVRDRAWTVTSESEHSLVCEFSSSSVADFNYPWPVSAKVSYELDGPAFRSSLVIRNSAAESIPVGGGFHPYFMKALVPGESVELRFQAEGVFLYDGTLPFADEPVAIPPAFDYSERRKLLEGLDHGYVGWDGTAEFFWPESGVWLDIEASYSAEHVIVYSPPGEPFFAFEPVSMSTDGFNQLAKGAEFTGVHELAPGEELEIAYTLTVSE